jgi:hypothetical protein
VVANGGCCRGGATVAVASSQMKMASLLMVGPACQPLTEMVSGCGLVCGPHGGLLAVGLRSSGLFSFFSSISSFLFPYFLCCFSYLNPNFF